MRHYNGEEVDTYNRGHTRIKCILIKNSKTIKRIKIERMGQMKLFSARNLNLESEEISEALTFAESKHYGQVRKNTNDPYITHPVAVASMISQLREDDEDMVIAGLLHDVVEDTEVEMIEIIDRFNMRIADLVLELTIDNEEKKKIGKRKYLVNRLNKMSSDAFTIKLVDRLHNISDMNTDETPVGFAKWYWKETKYLLEHIDRNLNKEQLALIGLIEATLEYLKVIYGFNYPISAD